MTHLGGRARIVAALYVAVVMILVGYAFRSGDQSFSWAEGVAMVLTLPTLLAALPGIYQIGAGLWSVTDASDGGGPMWLVTVGFVVMFGLTAVANVVVVSALAARSADRRSRKRVRGI